VLPEGWLYALGALFILTTLFLPRGIIGLFGWRPRSDSAAERAVNTAAREATG
jgi:urea transport system permease protein